MNLHALARGAITSVHPDETVTLYKSKGNTNIYGKLHPAFAPGMEVQAQVQSEGGDTLEQSREVNFTAQVRKCYLYADGPNHPRGILRWLGQGNDIIQRGDGSYWQVVAMLEDFSHVGWVAVRIQQIVEEPEMTIIPDPEPEPEPEPEEPEEPEEGEKDNGDEDNKDEGDGDEEPAADPES